MAHKFANLGVPVDGVGFPSVSPILRGDSLGEGARKKPVGGELNRDRSRNAEDIRLSGMDSRIGDEVLSERFDALIGKDSKNGDRIGMDGQSSFANLNVLRELSSQVEALFSRFTDLQNFLLQFDHAVVWNHFVDGKICGVPPGDLVESFRNLRTAITPGSIRTSASSFLTKLLLGCPGIPSEIGGARLPIRMTYEQWNIFFKDLRVSNYWQSQEYSMRERILKRESAISETNKIKFQQNAHGKSIVNKDSEKYRPDRHRDIADFSSSDEGMSEKRKCTDENRSKGHKNIRAKEDESSTSSSESDRSPFKNQDLVKTLLSIGRRKDVVKPEIYDGTGSDSLKDFLREYEHYFAEKYDGNDKQKSKILGEFLSGEIRDYYGAIRGNKSPYSDVKVKLKEWNRQHKVDGARRLEEKFDSAAMKSSETLLIYAVRLEQMGERIFANRTERERQLYRKFSKTVPQSFYGVLSTHERDLFASGREVSWEYIKNLALAQDRHQKNYLDADRDLYSDRSFSRYPSKKFTSKDREIMFGKASNAKQNEGNDWVDTRMEDRRRIVRCDWCGRLGHHATSCWVKLGYCELCGDENHQKTDCQKYNKIYGSYIPRCPICNGKHFGRDCKPLN